MRSLRELQQRFYDAVLLGDAHALDGDVRAGVIPAGPRLEAVLILRSHRGRARGRRGLARLGVRDHRVHASIVCSAAE